MITVRWGYMPPEFRQAVRPLLLQYLWLLPGWCRLLVVRFQVVDDGGNESVSASLNTCPEYRWAALEVNAKWITGCASQRRRDVIHEVLHVPSAPLAVEHQEAIKRLFEDGDAPKFKATLLENWRRAHEGMTEDLAHSIAMIPPDALPVVAFVEEEDEHPPMAYVA